MTFSEFANILYPFCGNGCKTSDFIAMLIENVIEENIKNPLDNHIDVLTKIFSGVRQLSQKDAAYILSKIDRFRFIDYLSSLTDDATHILSNKLNIVNIECNPYNVLEKCADIFVDIITSVAHKPKTRKEVKKERSTLSLEMAEEFFPNGVSRDINNDLYFLSEVRCVCPLCGKSLIRKKGNVTIPEYKITYINEPKVLYESSILYEPTNMESDKNKIALCLECNNTYLTTFSKEAFHSLMNKKQQLSNLSKALVDSNSVDLEDNLQIIIDELSKFSVGTFNDTLSNKALLIKNKIDSSNLLLIERTEFYVSRYYKYIEQLFINAEAEGVLDFNLVAQEVNLCFEKLLKLGLSQDEICIQLADWIKHSTKSSSDIACQIVVAFFIQNCEVFYEIT